MTNDPKDAIDRLREQIREADVLTERDRENLLKFSDTLELNKSDYSHQRHEKLLRHCAIMAGLSQRYDEGYHPDVELSSVLDDRDNAEEMVRWINRKHGDVEETHRDYRVALRLFAKDVFDGSEDDLDENDVPESVGWIKTTMSRSYDPRPNPGDMLDWNDDVLPMIDATRNNRDGALIAVAWDSGARSGEIRELTIGDVADHSHGLQITVDGKTGQRSTTLIPSVPYLRQWLNDHPAPDEPAAPLWSKLTEPEEIVYQQFRKSLREAAKRAGVTKPVTLTNFRKSQASYLASRGMNQAHIEDRMGWTRGSKVVAHYIQVFAKEADNELAKIHGKEVVVEEPEPIAPIECPRCDYENPRVYDACLRCGQALKEEAIKNIRERESEVRRAALQLVHDDPGMIDQIDRTEQLMTLIEGDPQLQEEALRLADRIREDI